MKTKRILALAVAFAAWSAALVYPSHAQETIVAPTWVEMAADGPHARTLAGDRCPDVTIDGTNRPMDVRAAPSAAFPDRVCDAAIPARTRNATIRGQALPLPHAVRKVVVIGDTGCRLEGQELQACGDGNAWPFPAIAADIANEHPDLIVHVGGYAARDSACAPDFDGCRGSPHGDTQPSWMADWFGPAAPLFTTAPLVLVRGDAETCERNGEGWFRYLDTGASIACAPHAKPFAVSVGGLQVVVFDSSHANDARVDASDVLEYATEFGAARRLASGDTWLAMNRPVYGIAQNPSRDALEPLNATLQAGASGDVLAPYAAVIAGHVRTFETLSLDGAPPVTINAMSGERLAAPITVTVKGTSVGSVTINDFSSDARFGYAVYDRTATGWTITVHAPDGAVFRRCTLGSGAVHCAS